MGCFGPVFCADPGLPPKPWDGFESKYIYGPCWILTGANIRVLKSEMGFANGSQAGTFRLIEKDYEKFFHSGWYHHNVSKNTARYFPERTQDVERRK